MKKANKAEVKEWREQAKEAKRLTQQLEEQSHLLWYAAEKRKTGYPSAYAFRECGRDDVAAEIEAAWAALGRAHSLLGT